MSYKTTVGIEVHCELKTNTKMFSHSKAGYGTSANSNVGPIDLGYPGALPILNQKAIDLATRAALILNCNITRLMHFDRKNYFYPDLPKGYQITQARTPIGTNGFVEIEVNGIKKTIRILDVHIEEDTAKSVHTENTSLLDYNRAGIPLIEIVTYPDMNSKEEAMAYVEKLRELLLYADVSDCKIEEGSMRCDVNVSISETDTLGVRAEIKNIGSISNVGLAIETEIIRQKEIYDQNGTIREETRRYDEKENKTVLMRIKETGNDYRYFPEPDLPFITLTEEQIEKIKNELPVSPTNRRELYRSKGILEINIEKIIQNRDISDYLLEADKSLNLVIASNILLGDVTSYLNKEMISIKETKLTIEKLTEVISLLEKGEITNKIVKEILEDLLTTTEPIDTIIKRRGITQINDTTSLLIIIEKVIKENQESVEDYKDGKERAIKYLMGQIMKETKGGANPALVNQLLIEALSK